ncbi:AsmA family protein, partial [Burkholderia latens]
MSSADKQTIPTTLHALGGVARSRRTRRIGFGVLIFLVLFGLLGFFAAPPLIRHVAEQQLSEQLGRPSTIQRIALNPYTLNLEADGVHVGERGGQGDFIDIGKLVVRPSWSSLFRGAPIVNEVRVDAPRFHIVRYDAQRFNFTDLIEKFSTPGKPNSKPTQFSVSNIQVNDGRIDFDDRLLNEKHVVDNWTLGIPFIATLPSKTDIFVQPKLRARFDGSPISIDGRTKPFAQSRESEVALKFDRLDVPKLISYAPSKLPVIVTSGLLSSDLSLNFVMSGDTPTLRVSGTVDLNDAKVTDRASAPLFAARGVHVAAAGLEPLRNALHFDEIRLDQPVVDLARDRQGVLNVEKLAGQPAAAQQAAAARSPAPGAAASASASAA